jgi:hypothetical protein
MRTSSRKAKGRRLQNWVRDELLSRFPKLTDEDVYCAIMGESGADVKLSPLAQTFTGIYKIIEQAHSNCKTTQVPLGVIKKNNLQPLVIVDARHFLDLVSKNGRQ